MFFRKNRKGTFIDSCMLFGVIYHLFSWFSMDNWSFYTHKGFMDSLFRVQTHFSKEVKNSTRFRLTQVLRYWMLTKVLFLFQTNNRQVISGAANGGVRVWDVISGECLQHLRGHVKSVTAVTCTAEHLLSVSLESVLCIWDRARGECLHRLKQVRGSEEAS